MSLSHADADGEKGRRVRQILPYYGVLRQKVRQTGGVLAVRMIRRTKGRRPLMFFPYEPGSPVANFSWGGSRADLHAQTTPRCRTPCESPRRRNALF